MRRAHRRAPHHAVADASLPGERVNSARMRVKLDAGAESLCGLRASGRHRWRRRARASDSPRIEKSRTLMTPSCGDWSAVGGSIAIHICPPITRE